MPPTPKALAAFSELQRAKAREIIAKLQSGETIPLDEMVAFLGDSSRALQAQVVEKEKARPQTDVDFF